MNCNKEESGEVENERLKSQKHHKKFAGRLKIRVNIYNHK